jgi:hypothetical protein
MSSAKVKPDYIRYHKINKLDFLISKTKERKMRDLIQEKGA